MKKGLIFIIFFISFFFISCSNDNPSDTTSFYSYTTLYETKKGNCFYSDSVILEENYNLKNEIKYLKEQRGIDKNSYPFFQSSFYISETSNNKNLPNFYVAGDTFIFKAPYKVKVISEGMYIDSHLPWVGGELNFNENSDVDYIQAKVEKISEDNIHRENGEIKTVDNMFSGLESEYSISHITIDKEYNYINLCDYDGDELFASFYSNGSVARFYSFNPLEE